MSRTKWIAPSESTIPTAGFDPRKLPVSRRPDFHARRVATKAALAASTGGGFVGPLGAVDNVRPFAVRLLLDTPAETITTRYLVVGQDPLWVFRQEDYELILHWEHKMTDEERGSSPESPTAKTGTTSH